MTRFADQFIPHMKDPLITREEIAKAAGVSEDTVKRKEKTWGLDKCRSKATNRPLFFRAKASDILLSQSIIPVPL